MQLAILYALPSPFFSEVSTSRSLGSQNSDHNANSGLQETKPQDNYCKPK